MSATPRPNPQLQQALERHRAGQHEQALAIVRRYLTKNPNDPDANQMGALLSAQLKQVDQGLYFAQRAARSAPDRADVQTTLGKMLHFKGDTEGAVGAFERAIALDPTLADAYMSLGACLQHTGRLDEALAAAARAAELRPDHAETRVNLALLHLDRGEADAAVDTLREATRLDPRSILAWDTLALALNYDQRATSEEVFTAHKRFGELVEGAVRPMRTHTNPPDPERRLRIGYLSRDMRRHSVAYFLQTIFEAHDRDQVEVCAYSTTLSPDDMTERLRGLTDLWRDAGELDDGALAERIRQDRVDVLVELSGHFSGHRLGVMALCPAPVQATYLGYPNTTGLTRINARLVDERTDPQGADRFATESLVRLAGCFLCYAPSPEAPGADEATSPLPMAAAGHVTLGSFNDLKKLSPTTLDLWSRIMRELPTTRLILKNRGFDTPALRARVASMLRERGVDEQRVEIIPHVRSMREHLAVYDRIDLALDTFPYHGTTTTCEAAWMGVPTLTLAGKTHAGRVGVSLNTTLGLDGFIATTPDEYVSKAVTLAGDAGRLAEVRRGLRTRMSRSPLCDRPGFARRLEGAYRELWRAWCARQTGGNRA
ncbi:MAG: tetratricopeptide repeat protein [Phycisphaerales bacterium]